MNKVILLADEYGGFVWPSGRDAIAPLNDNQWAAWPGCNAPHVSCPSPEAAAEAIGALLPPRVGDRWGNLTPEQWARVTVGSELGGYGEDGKWSQTSATKSANGRWRIGASDFSDSSIGADRRIIRLGPVPKAPAEADRSGRQVLVKDNVAKEDYYCRSAPKLGMADINNIILRNFACDVAELAINYGNSYAENRAFLIAIRKGEFPDIPDITCVQRLLRRARDLASSGNINDITLLKSAYRDVVSAASSFINSDLPIRSVNPSWSIRMFNQDVDDLYDAKCRVYEQITYAAYCDLVKKYSLEAIA